MFWERVPGEPESAERRWVSLMPRHSVDFGLCFSVQCRLTAPGGGHQGRARGTFQ